MHDPAASRLSDLSEQLGASPDSDDIDPAVLVLGGSTDRRSFLTRASALSLVIPGVGAALAACSPGQARRRQCARRGGQTPAPPPAAPQARQPHNSDSRLDSAVLKGEHRAAHVGHRRRRRRARRASRIHRYDPALPPLAAGGSSAVTGTRARRRSASATTPSSPAWTFEGDIPGPIVHCRVGDTVEFTLTNDADIPHSMDFHAAQIDPKAGVPVGGEGAVRHLHLQAEVRRRLHVSLRHRAGAHAHRLGHVRRDHRVAARAAARRRRSSCSCRASSTSPTPRTACARSTTRRCSTTLPDFVAFNGRPNQYMKEPIRVKVGDRVRFWVVSAGPDASVQLPRRRRAVRHRVPRRAAAHRRSAACRRSAVPPGGGMVLRAASATCRASSRS